jgi:hypothetical protein
MEIYNAVIGEPERVKDDYYYRSRKAVLMHEMSQRFGQLIRACRQLRGEERFETQPGSSELRSLMRECLRLFTPWDTRCHVPRDFDPLKSVIASLTSKSSAEENEVEVNRIHAVLHPDCFERLVAAFDYSSPEERMELPRFFSDEPDDDAPPRQRSAPADLSAEELAEINHMLDEQAGRRLRSSPTAVIRILVDGIERARLDPAEQSSISFSAGEDAEIIEVKTTDSQGDLLLATHLLTSFAEDAQDAAIVSSIRLESGQDLSLTITRRQIEASGGPDLMVKFGCRETAPWRIASLWWQRLRRRLTRDPNSRSIWADTRIIMAGSLVIIICLTSYVAYVKLRSDQTSGPTVTSVAQTPPVPEPSISASPIVEAKATKPGRRAKIERSTAAKETATSEDATRSGNVVANLTLKDVKKIYIEIRGDAATDELRSNLVESLNSSGVVSVVTDPDDADAALKIVVSQTSVSAKLVNARGTVLWQKAGQGKVGSEIVKDLLSAIRRGA